MWLSAKRTKGGAIIVLDSEVYRWTNWKLLSDHTNYRPLLADPTSDILSVLTRLVQREVSTGVLTQKQAYSIICDNPVMAIFHSLPKIHKPGSPPSFHPIVAGICSLNEGLCAWVDSLLQPLIGHIPGYLQDSREVFLAFEDFYVERWYDVGYGWRPHRCIQ